MNPKHHDKKKTTEVTTFRLDADLLESLRQEASQKDITVNTLVSQIIKEHVRWHANAPKAGVLPVRKALIKKLMEKYDEQDVKLIGRHVANLTNKDFLLMLTNVYNVESALECIETWSRISGYQYKHGILTSDKNMHRYIIQHDMGKKWSTYLAELCRSIFDEFGIRNANFEITDNMLAFTVNTECMSNN